MTDPTGYAGDSICTTHAGFSEGCEGQDLSDLKSQQFGKSFGQLQSLVHQQMGKGVNVGMLNGQAAMAVTGLNGVAGSQGIADTANTGGHAAIGVPSQLGTNMNGVQITGEMKPIPYNFWLDTPVLGSIVSGIGNQLGWITSPFHGGQAVNPFSHELVTGEELFDAKFLALTAIIPVGDTASVEGEAARALESGVDEALVRVGYHATNSANVDAILEKGLRLSESGRLGGAGVYVNNTSRGAIAEYMFHHPDETAPTVLRIQYEEGLNYFLNPAPGLMTRGPLPFAADTITTESLRIPGTFNTIIRNNSVRINPQ